MTEHKIDKSIVITGILCVTGLELAAMYMGYNGVILTAVIAVIAGAVGLSQKKPKFLK